MARVFTTRPFLQERRFNSAGRAAKSPPPPLHRSCQRDWFHARSGGDAILDAAWTIENSASKSVIARSSTNFTEPVREEGYEGLVNAENRLLSRFADAIAASFPKR